MGNFKPVPGRIPGTLINLGGVEFVMPPLNLDQVRQFTGVMGELASITGQEGFDKALPVIHAALSRNYPELTIEELRLLLDLGNLAPTVIALSKSSGYVASNVGEPQPAPR